MSRPPSMQYDFCARTDPGRARSNNEDAVATDPATGLAVLADGMGGYNAGEIASGMAVTFIRSELSRWLGAAGTHAASRDIRRAMEICVANANHSIYNAANSNPQYAGMGTTLVAAVFSRDRLVLGHIGDSRGYRLRGGVFTRLTRDHSLLQEQLDAGMITAEEAAVSTHKNLVTRALGVEASAALEVNEHRVEAGDLYLLCSDGLSDMLDDPQIASLMVVDAPLEPKADALVGAANARGGRDNISVLLIQVGAGPRRRGLMSRLLRH